MTVIMMSPHGTTFDFISLDVWVHIHSVFPLSLSPVYLTEPKIHARSIKMVDYEAVVIGSGPGGLSTVAALLDTDINRILWVDRDFTGGRLNTMYREISS